MSNAKYHLLCKVGFEKRACLTFSSQDHFRVCLPHHNKPIKTNLEAVQDQNRCQDQFRCRDQLRWCTTVFFQGNIHVAAVLKAIHLKRYSFQQLLCEIYHSICHWLIVHNQGAWSLSERSHWSFWLDIICLGENKFGRNATDSPRSLLPELIHPLFKIILIHVLW